MKPNPFPIPVVGAGSQPDDEPLHYLASPGEMTTFRPPHPRPPASPEALERARTLLSRLLASMTSRPFGAAPAPSLDLSGESPAVVAEINELLGQGEVACRVDGPGSLRIQESAFPAVWRVQEHREDGSLAVDRIDTGPIPRAVLEALARPRERPPEAVPGPGIMNAPAILHELHEASAARADAADGAAHVVNLTLLPVSPEDVACLATALGTGPVQILSRGYGNCRITSTAVPRVWWVQYFNAMDQLILDTLEVVGIPEVALAAREDYDDSKVRLAEWIATLDA